MKYNDYKLISVSIKGEKLDIENICIIKNKPWDGTWAPVRISGDSLANFGDWSKLDNVEVSTKTGEASINGSIQVEFDVDGGIKTCKNTEATLEVIDTMIDMIDPAHPEVYYVKLWAPVGVNVKAWLSRDKYLKLASIFCVNHTKVTEVEKGEELRCCSVYLNKDLSVLAYSIYASKDKESESVHVISSTDEGYIEKLGKCVNIDITNDGNVVGIKYESLGTRGLYDIELQGCDGVHFNPLYSQIIVRSIITDKSKTRFIAYDIGIILKSHDRKTTAVITGVISAPKLSALQSMVIGKFFKCIGKNCLSSYDNIQDIRCEVQAVSECNLYQDISIDIITDQD